MPKIHGFIIQGFINLLLDIYFIKAFTVQPKISAILFEFTVDNGNWLPQVVVIGFGFHQGEYLGGIYGFVELTGLGFGGAIVVVLLLFAT